MHVMRKYRDETEFMIISINKIKLTQEKIKTLSKEALKDEIKEAKERMNSETNKEEKKEKKKIYDDLNGFKELYKCEKEMKEMMENLKKTAKIFKLNYYIDILNSDVEINELKNKNELVDINAKYKIYKDQIFRINYQKYSIYKEWAEIKSFILLRNSNKNNKNKDKDKDKNNIQAVKKENIDITNINENNNNDNKQYIESNENILNLENSENIEVNNRNNSNQEKSEFKRIKDQKQKDDFEFRKLVLPKKTIIYYKIMPIISYILILICIAYDIIIIFGQVEYTFKWDIFSGKVLRWFFANSYIITPIRLFPFYFTFFVFAYSFGTIKSDLSFCIYAPRQTEPCHMLCFVGMLAKLICPLCYNYIGIMYNGFSMKGSRSKLSSYFEEQFGYLNSDNIVISIAKIILLFLFLKAICCTASRCYGNYAYKKNQYLTFHSTYEGKESEILMGELILNKLNKSYGNDLNQLKIDNIFEYEEKK